MSDEEKSEPILTETHVIIIACVCGVIIVTLLVILFCFIFRRRRNAAKSNYESGTPSGDPPPYTSVSASHKKPHQNSNTGQPGGGGGAITNHTGGGGGGYDNQDGPLDLHHHQQHPHHQHQVSAAGGAPLDEAAAVLYLGQGHQGHRSPRRLAAETEKHLYENQLNQWSENNRMDGYPNREPQSPNKDKYIDLQDRGGGGDMMDYGMGGEPNGQPGAAGAGGKPKKVIYEVVV